MKKFVSLLLLTTAVFTTPAFALNEVELVANFNQYPNSIARGDVLVVNGKVFFEGSDPVNGEELWVLDSENSEPRLVKDINPGPDGCNPNNFIVFKNRLYFTAETENEGTELWYSDGTEAGTQLVRDLNPGDDGSSPDDLTLFGPSNGRLAFTARINVFGREFCISNGESNGTTCYDINPGTDSSSPDDLAVLNEDLYFGANDGTNGDEMWRMGSIAGAPQLFLNIRAGGSSSGPSGFTPFTGPGNTPMLIFRARGNDGREPWITDGTVGNTVQLADLEAGTDSSEPSTFFEAPFGGVIFTARVNDSGQELWKTDGTPGGTTKVKEIYPGFEGPRIDNLTPFGNILYFSAEDGTHGEELWRTDGTSNGTFMVKDIRDGERGSNPRWLKIVAGKLFFSATDEVVGDEIFETDGTEAGTKTFADIYPGRTDGRPEDPFMLNNKLGVFADGETEPAVFIIDPNNAANQTVIPASLETDEGSRAEVVATMPNGELLVRLRTREFGGEPHILNPETREIRLLKDISPGPNSSNFDYLGTVNEKVILRAEGEYENGEEPWVTDGTEAGTMMLKDIVPGVDSSRPTDIDDFKEAYNGFIYFKADLRDPTFRQAIYRTDGTPEGTEEFAPGLNFTDSVYMTLALGGQLFFTAETPTSNGVAEIYKTDGTEAGTVKLTDQSVSNLTFYTRMYEHDGMLFMGADDNSGERELYKFDGTAGGVTLAAEDQTPNRGLGPFHFYSFGNRLAFSARSSLGPSYYYIDPPYTQAQLGLLVDPAPTNSIGGSGAFFELFDKVLFTTTTEVGGNRENNEPWITDGTPGGTKIFKIIRPGEGATEMNQEWVRGGDYYYFAANGGDPTGQELWRSDGTPDGTELFEDLLPGPDEASPDIFGAFRGAVYFTYRNKEIGDELYRIVFDECPDDINKVEAGACGCGSPDVDSDGDGTLDCSDQCPADALKATTGACGCGNLETDSDGDGTPDCADACNADVNKASVGDCGCGVADEDLDGSGVSDCLIAEEVKVRSDLLATLLDEFKRKPKKGRKLRLRAIFQAYKELNRYSRTQLAAFTNSTAKKTKKRLKNLRRKVKKFRQKSTNKNKRKTIKALARFLAIAP